MSSSLKAISNPYSTGGGGIIFENQIQSSFVVVMLAGGFLPCLTGKKIKKIKLQCKNAGFSMDDIVAYAADSMTNTEHKLLAQIKHEISITNSDNQFQEVISAAWDDFNNPAIFHKEHDALALITGPLSKSDIYDTRVILDWARHSEDATDFLENKIRLPKFCSNQKRNKVEVFRSSLKRANQNTAVSDELFYSFLRHFHIIGYDLDIKAGVAHCLLTSIINQFQQDDKAISIWSRISEEVYSYNQNAGTITAENLPSDITEYFSKGIENRIPKDYTKPSIDEIAFTKGIDSDYDAILFIASILGTWNENSQGDREAIRELTSGF